LGENSTGLPWEAPKGKKNKSIHEPYREKKRQRRGRVPKKARNLQLGAIRKKPSLLYQGQTFGEVVETNPGDQGLMGNEEETMLYWLGLSRVVGAYTNRTKRTMVQ